MSATGRLLVHPRIVRRVIKHQLRIAGFGLHIPHDHCAAVLRTDLLRLASPEELGGVPLPDEIVLIARDDELTPRELWRRDFHGRVHLALDALRRRGALPDGVLRARIHAIGQTEFDEIRAVLRQEDLILSSRDDALVYVEFAATYLDHRYFDPEKLVQIFPTIQDHERVLETLGADLDAAALLESCRPEGEAPATLRPVDASLDEDHQIETRPPEVAPPTAAERAALRSRAAHAERRGNLARAAICWHRASLGDHEAKAGDDKVAAGDRKVAAGVSDRKVAVSDRKVAAGDGKVAAGDGKVAAGGSGEASGAGGPEVERVVEALVGRLLRALGEGEEARSVWREVLRALVTTAAARPRLALGPEARLLLDLQKACVAREEPRRVVDVVGWARSRGRRAIVRELPAVQRINVVRYLRSAQLRAGRARLERGARLRLVATLVEALRRADEGLRRELGPRIRAALESAGLRPTSAPERVALRKLVDELLDQAASRGFLSFGHLRDGVSRSHLKLADLAGPGELWRGDALLRADALLAAELDGVYRGGEAYLRGLQKGSSLFFGTAVGRALTLHLLLPLIGSFVILEGLQHLAAPLARRLFHVEHLHLLTPWTMLALALFLYGLIHGEAFRSAVSRALRALGGGLHGVFVGLPRWFLGLAPVRAFLESGPVVALWRFVLKPALVVAPLYGLLARRMTPIHGLETCGGLFLGLTLGLNTPPGIALQERLSTGMARSWRFLSRRLLPGLVSLLSDLSRQLVEGVDRLLYAVDEWLRFREGESRFALVLKGALGVLWFLVTYLVRLGVNVLFEPQVNPIKHFPVVTVSHKILLPMTPGLASGLQHLGLSGRQAMSLAVPLVGLLPGAVGFLVWELKGNWDLYGSNRSPALKPVLVGHHGETVGALLKPGFHSGTVPKLFTRLRRAIRHGDAKAGKYREQLRDVEHGIHRFLERELSAPLEESPRWPHGPLAVASIDLGSNRIRVALACAAVGPEAAVLHFEEQSGWLVASVARRGWIDALDPELRDLFEASLAGLYRLAGVDLCREQIEEQIRSPYDIADEGLLVWPGGDYQRELVYPLDDRDQPPRVRGNPLETAPPSLDKGRLLLRRQPVTWASWLALWESPDAPASALPSLRRTSLLP